MALLLIALSSLNQNQGSLPADKGNIGRVDSRHPRHQGEVYAMARSSQRRLGTAVSGIQTTGCCFLLHRSQKSDWPRPELIAHASQTIAATKSASVSLMLLPTPAGALLEKLKVDRRNMASA